MSWLCHMLVNSIFCFMLQDVFFVFLQPLFCLTSCFADVAGWAIWAFSERSFQKGFNGVSFVRDRVITGEIEVPISGGRFPVNWAIQKPSSEENDRKTTEETHGTKAPSSTRKIENCLCSLYKRNIWTCTKILKKINVKLYNKPCNTLKN